MIGDLVGLEGRAMQNENGGGGVAYFAPNLNVSTEPGVTQCQSRYNVSVTDVSHG